MSKISRNIKRLRNEKGFSQESLAERIHITRQAVSSWENDRTQPDVEMLGVLAEVFEVSLEELIYGKKRNTQLELEKTNYNSTLIIVFSILGTLLAGAGLVLIFVTFWKDMPLFSKGILSFIPLVIGQAAGIFVLARKSDTTSWCEGGSVLWTAGIAATLTMIYNIFDLSIDWENILLLVCVSVLPVMFILKAVAPLVVYYGCGLGWGIMRMSNIREDTVIMVSMIALTVLGCLFSLCLYKLDKKSGISIYSQWISVVAVVAMATTYYYAFIGEELLLSGAMTVAVCLIIISCKHSDITLPYRLLGLIGASILMLFFSWNIMVTQWEIHTNILFAVVPIVLATGLSTLYIKGKFTDKFMLLFIIVAALCLILYVGENYLLSYKAAQSEPYLSAKDYDAITNPFRIIFMCLSALGYIFMMVSGAKDKKLLPINIGFVSFAALTTLIVTQSGFSMLGSGIMLVVFGAVLLVINFSISKSKLKLPAAENTVEVHDDEK